MGCEYVTPEGQPCLLQDHTHEIYHSGVNNKDYCIYHLPQHQGQPEADKLNWSVERVANFNKGMLRLTKVIEDAGEILDMQGCVFPPGLSFDEMELPDCKFDRAVFLGGSSFTGVKFLGGASFSVSSFKNGCDFSSATFCGEANFNHADVRGELSFLGAVFEKMAKFLALTSHNDVCFVGAKLKSNMLCSNIRVNGRLDFKEAVFDGVTILTGGNFGMVVLSDAAANAPFFINDAVVSEGVFSLSASFNDMFDMSGCENRRSLGAVNFGGSIFKSEVSFMNRDFLSITTFDECLFKKAPKFHNSTLHQDTGFDSAVFEDASKDAARSYRTLKQAMEGVRSRREEGMFFALEQRCLRGNKSISGSVRFLSWLYDATSSYGQSATKPFYWMLGILVAFTGIYAAIASPVISMEASFDSDAIKNAIALSVKQAVTPFYIWKERGVELTVQLLGTLQSILFLSMFALFILAVRWRFKRG